MIQHEIYFLGRPFISYWRVMTFMAPEIKGLLSCVRVSAGAISAIEDMLAAHSSPQNIVWLTLIRTIKGQRRSQDGNSTQQL